MRRPGIEHRRRPRGPSPRARGAPGAAAPARRSSRRAGRLRVEEQVLGDGERRDHGRLLVDAGDPLAPALAVGEAGRVLRRRGGPGRNRARAARSARRPGSTCRRRCGRPARANRRPEPCSETSLSAWLAPKRFETPIASATGEAAQAGAPRAAALASVPRRSPARRCHRALFDLVAPERRRRRRWPAVTIGAGSRSIRLPLNSSIRLS